MTDGNGFGRWTLATNWRLVESRRCCCTRRSKTEHRRCAAVLAGPSIFPLTCEMLKAYKVPTYLGTLDTYLQEGHLVKGGLPKSLDLVVVCPETHNGCGFWTLVLRIQLQPTDKAGPRRPQIVACEDESLPDSSSAKEASTCLTCAATHTHMTHAYVCRLASVYRRKRFHIHHLPLMSKHLLLY